MGVMQHYAMKEQVRTQVIKPTRAWAGVLMRETIDILEFEGN